MATPPSAETSSSTPVGTIEGHEATPARTGRFEACGHSWRESRALDAMPIASFAQEAPPLHPSRPRRRESPRYGCQLTCTPFVRLNVELVKKVGSALRYQHW